MSDTEENTHSAKRRKVSNRGGQNDDIPVGGGITPLASLSRTVTPPPSRRPLQIQGQIKQRRTSAQNLPSKDGHTVIPSPIQLTHIRDLSDSSGNNNDTIRLRDILGDPMIKECWQFNFCFDVDFIMDQFDPDVRDIVQVKVVHGSWKKEAPNRIRIDVSGNHVAGERRSFANARPLQEQCSRYPNVEPICAYMPEPFGTHHSKMMILLRHDDLAQ